VDNTNIYLMQSDCEKYDLLLDIASLKRDELPVKKRIELSRNNNPLVDDVNLKQVATLLNRNYGSLYNMYMSIVDDLKKIVGQDTEETQLLFSVPSDVYHFSLVSKSDVYDFVKILLTGEEMGFQTFWEDHNSSKATVLRHLKSLRDFIRSFDVRIFYDPIRLEGDESTIRLILIMLFWMATDGHSWPFEAIDRDDALEAFDVTVERFQLAQPNLLTREIGGYAMAVIYHRVMQKKFIKDTSAQDIIRYPVPNMTHEFMVRPFTREAIRMRSILAQMTDQEAMLESLNMYYTFNFSPIFLHSNNRYALADGEQHTRYVPEINQFVSDFVDRIPLNVHYFLKLDDAEVDILKRTLIAMTASTYIYKKDVTSRVNRFLLDANLNLKEDQLLKRDVEDTVDHLFMNSDVDFLKDMHDEIVNGYYNVFIQLIQQRAPLHRVNVVLVAEQSYMGYLDLLTDLKGIRYVNISMQDADLKDADMIITTSSIELPDDVNPQAVMFKWRRNADSDHYGRMYGILRELWLQKSTECD